MAVIMSESNIDQSSTNSNNHQSGIAGESNSNDPASANSDGLLWTSGAVDFSKLSEQFLPTMLLPSAVGGSNATTIQAPVTQTEAVPIAPKPVPLAPNNNNSNNNNPLQQQQIPLAGINGLSHFALASNLNGAGAVNPAGLPRALQSATEQSVATTNGSATTMDQQQQQQQLWQQALQSLTFGGGGAGPFSTSAAVVNGPQHAFFAAAAAAAVAGFGAAPSAAQPSSLQLPASLYPAAAAAASSPAVSVPPPIAPAPESMTNNNHKRRLGENGDDLLGNGKKAKSRKVEASVISNYSSNGDFNNSSFAFNNSNNGLLDDEQAMPQQASDADLAKMTPAERRRYERNLREQQRSYRISQQIKHLRDLLSESSVPFKPNKFSILVNVVEYIKQLQARAIMLDAEHQRLIDTIRQTNEIVSSGQILANPDSDDSDSKEVISSMSASDSSSDLLMVQGIDYEGLFERCPFPLGVASLDGRILAANPSFEKMLDCNNINSKSSSLSSSSSTGKSKHHADHRPSLFIYIRNHQEIFEAMADLLKRSSIATETGEITVRDNSPLLFWCGHVVSSKNEKMPFNITLTSTPDGNPKFFSISGFYPRD